MFMTPSESSRRRSIISKYISGNQKHLTLIGQTHIENELAKMTPIKDINSAYIYTVYSAV